MVLGVVKWLSARPLPVQVSQLFLKPAATTPADEFVNEALPGYGFRHTVIQAKGLLHFLVFTFGELAPQILFDALQFKQRFPHGVLF